MALIKCASCGRYMGVGVTRYIYCGRIIDEQCTVIGAERPKCNTPEKEDNRSKSCTNALAVCGLFLAGIGAVISTMLPVIGIPAVFAGGMMLLKSNKSKKE